MKILCVLFGSLFTIFFLGCSSTYKISDFNTKNEFYENFNKSANNKTVQVMLDNDSSFIMTTGVKISNDSLISYEEIIDTLHVKLSLFSIKDLTYSNISKTSATIILNSGELYKALQIKKTNDSIYFFITKNIKTRKGITQIKNVKEISYKNHWPGLSEGFLVGTLGGLIIGGLFSQYYDSSIDKNDQTNAGLHIGIGILATGLLTGSVLGWINGYTYTYQFNP